MLYNNLYNTLNIKNIFRGWYDMNYESEIETLIIEELKHKFSINNFMMLYKYLRLRNRCINYNYKWKTESKFEDESFLNSIIIELGINKMVYKNVPIHVIYNRENSIKNIIDGWNKIYLDKMISNSNGIYMSINDSILKDWDDIKYYADCKIKGLKSTYKDKMYVYYKLKQLNFMFGINEVNNIRQIDGFSYDENSEYDIPLEIKLKRYIDAASFRTSNLNTITEKDFESYVFRHLEDIEYGLRPIERQRKIDEGRLDILAIDKNNSYVILELKIVNDKHLLWQVLYYPDALKKQFGNIPVRMITVCPSYPEYILSPLNKIDYAEAIKYSLVISGKKIEQAYFRKIK